MNIGVFGRINASNIMYEEEVNKLDYLNTFGEPGRISLIESGATLKVFYKFK